MRTAGSAASPDTAGISLRAQLFDDLAIFFGDHKRDALRGQRLADAPTDAPITDQHDLAGKTVEIDSHRQRGQGIVGALHGLSELRARANPSLRRFDGAEEQRVKCD